MRRLPDELIGYYLQDKHYYPNNRLLQRPVVLLRRLAVSTSIICNDNDDLLPAADLLESAEISDCEEDETLTFFQPIVFANGPQQADPLNGEPIERVNGTKPTPPPYRYNASVMHGMATKHLDQMVENMPSPATSFSTELDDEELDDSSYALGATVIPDSLESSAGTE